MSEPRGVNLYGYISANVGLSVAARNTLRMLVERGVPTKVIDLDPGAGTGGRDQTYADAIERSREMPYQPINLFHLNPDRLRYMIRPFERTLDLEHRVNAIVPFWEAPRVPRSWLPTLRAMDVILAPTRFVRDAVLADLPDANVIHYPQTVFLPDGSAADRTRWSIPNDAIAFVTSFAVASDMERKNPWAVIDAFERAFPKPERELLVVKVNNPKPHPRLDQLRAAAARNPAIRLIEEPLSYPEVLGLYASCDVFVSLHRSEGLGLGLLEAMSLGKPVIGTGWSGNMDFMTAENSVPVPYELVDIDVDRFSPYHPTYIGLQTQWAEPDVGAAADAMRELAGDAELRATIGVQALADAEAGRREFLESQTLISLPAKVTRVEPKQAIRALRLSFAPDYAARIARGVTRRLRSRGLLPR